MKIGKQYDKDDYFKRKARYHQSKFRQKLNIDFNEYGNRLIDEDAKKYFNYYNKLNIIEELRKRYPNYSAQRDADMLRSEHIPFNFFAPLIEDYQLAKNVFSHFINNEITKINSIKIEYAPKPKNKYLDDGTSFDTYIEYLNKKNELCGIGIEVKYTEQAYSLKAGSKEEIDINNKNSLYYSVTLKSDIYKTNPFNILKSDNYRQIWRNHILGESMKPEIKDFYSLTIYPKGNKHFHEIIPKYVELLKEEKKKYFVAVTFEEFLSILKNENTDQNKFDWINYLEERYLFK